MGQPPLWWLDGFLNIYMHWSHSRLVRSTSKSLAETYTYTRSPQLRTVMYSLCGDRSYTCAFTKVYLYFVIQIEFVAASSFHSRGDISVNQVTVMFWRDGPSTFVGFLTSPITWSVKRSIQMKENVRVRHCKLFSEKLQTSGLKWPLLYLSVVVFDQCILCFVRSDLLLVILHMLLKCCSHCTDLRGFFVRQIINMYICWIVS